MFTFQFRFFKMISVIEKTNKEIKFLFYFNEIKNKQKQNTFSKIYIYSLLSWRRKKGLYSLIKTIFFKLFSILLKTLFYTIEFLSKNTHLNQLQSKFDGRNPNTN